MGTAYPPQVARCLSTLANMSAQEVQERYGLADGMLAQFLLSRATGGRPGVRTL